MEISPATAYKHPAEDVVKFLDSSNEQGLESTDAMARLERDGANEISESGGKSLFAMFITQFKDLMIIILLAAAVISGVIGDVKDTIVILVIIVLNALIGVVQEYRAEQAIAALKKMSNPLTKVMRDGVVATISTGDLAVGDIVLLEAGNIVPADLRLIETVNLQIDESALTGESLAIIKQSQTLKNTDLILGDQKNMAWKGTLVNQGRARAVVVAVGMKTELGRIASLLRDETFSQTPLQKRLIHFGRYLAIAVLLICLIIFLAGILQGQPLLLMLLTAISLAVAAIPEALPAVITISLAMGARQMSKHNALIRRLPAVETLGSVTYICTDKTGTLTQNSMQLELIFADGKQFKSLNMSDPVLQRLGQAMMLNNDVSEHEDKLIGEPTEIALYQSAKNAGFYRAKLEQILPRVDEIQFSSERKFMSTLHADDSASDARLLFSKGAPEVLLPLCKSILTSKGIDKFAAEPLFEEVNRLAAKGYRVLAFAYKELTEHDAANKQNLEADLIFLGFAALMDPPRPEATSAVAECISAGITPVMITGDHPGTALAIGQRVGMAGQDSRIVTGAELIKLSDAQFEQIIKSVKIYARVSPEQKIRIVKMLRRQGQFVAMTGDGINDAPALKNSDIGVAMGQKGTDVAREAADMVLLDDNFATIVAAVRAGRKIFANIKKFIKYTMTSNSGEIWTLFLAPILGLPIPLLPIHILWINLVTDGLPGLALASEPAERNLMRQPPRPPEESIFSHGMWQHILFIGLLIGILSIAGQVWAIKSGSSNWQTIVFTVLTFSQLFHAMAVRSDSASLFSLRIFSNRPLLLAVVFSVLLQLAVIYLPIFNQIFKTMPLTGFELLVCLLLSSVILLATEIEKVLVRSGKIYQN